jgi:polyisoprenoid-binding protein YceI
MLNRDVSKVVAIAAVVIALGPVRAGRAQSPPLAPGDINLEASRIYVFVDKTGFGHQHGVEGRLREGGLRLTGRAAGRMVFDLQSLKADTALARRYVGLKGEIDQKTQRDVTATMQSPDVLDVRRFPSATFSMNSVLPVETRTKSGKTQYRFEGEFRLHGARHPLRFVAEGVEERGYLHLKGSFRLRQTDYKIRPYQKGLGTVGVADVLTVYGDIWVKQ